MHAQDTVAGWLQGEWQAGHHKLGSHNKGGALCHVGLSLLTQFYSRQDTFLFPNHPHALPHAFTNEKGPQNIPEAKVMTCYLPKASGITSSRATSETFPLFPGLSRSLTIRNYDSTNNHKIKKRQTGRQRNWQGGTRQGRLR